MRKEEFVQQSINRIKHKKAEIMKIAEYSAGVYDALADACIGEDALKEYTDNYNKSSKEQPR